MENTQHPSAVFREKYYLTDGGLETTLIFNKGFSLNSFAAFELLKTEAGRKAFEEYFQPYQSLAEQYQMGFVMESPTWRANPDWGAQLGYSRDDLFALNKQSIYFIQELTQPFSHSLPHIVISGNIGPRGDGYKAENRMTADQAMQYHLEQIKAFAAAGADIVTAVTMTYSDEAIGIIQAAQSLQIPVVASFTVETDGKLPGGELLHQAIEKTDQATNKYAEHFMINCAHPQHFLPQMENEGDWKNRVRGIRANASLKSHAELDESVTLDAGDKCLLAEGYVQLFHLLPELKVIGGCCGTDHSHLEEICKTLKEQEILTA
ncbi:homocysteine methyltransferase [Niastella yeongjuensis]|uniref:Homocysteine methyltransferase n=1 Tax=Niastella yeongjuensis TaxID=354355 RepID=A0A1V9ELC7_9BACT|nr:homocysteine S-methyltransferase family protein [Niastella yeongjuensis]OQP46852.1 homocysteine methyltransferase [Niastella yeongjuensis]SEN57175.1 homocysteine S-methyltransferase [Niastella yeongjuensis]